ncbi:MAG: DsbA family oxidoreductase [Paracoccaceae bacterium]
MIKLDIVSDVACPWCYLGQVFLWRALEAKPDHPLAIEWHPFELNPDMPPEGMDRGEYLAARFGPPETVARMHEPLIARAAEAGAALDLSAIRRTPNTRDAHRVIHWAGLEGRQSPAVARIMRAYWAEGRDIGDATVLAELAGEAGLDRAAIARLLAGDSDRDEIAAREDHSRRRGVNAVPAFVIASRYVVQGAQPTEAWLGILNDLAGLDRDGTGDPA